jgi:hypothetical protein
VEGGKARLGKEAGGSKWERRGGWRHPGTHLYSENISPLIPGATGHSHQGAPDLQLTPHSEDSDQLGTFLSSIMQRNESKLPARDRGHRFPKVACQKTLVCIFTSPWGGPSDGGRGAVRGISCRSEGGGEMCGQGAMQGYHS